MKRSDKTTSPPLSPMEAAEMPSPTAETRDRLPVDRMLREKGWRIESRPREGEPLWRKGNLVCPQSEAMWKEGL